LLAYVNRLALFPRHDDKLKKGLINDSAKEVTDKATE